ncbi:MAG TPA: hypothetical protein VJU82_18760, partial [Acidobacteriaceae bacterium]|nr:hypothetical protein [Acidobacteriaceae bacterium]
SDGPSCLVVNPEVIRQWTQNGTPVRDLASAATSGFQNLLIHAVRPDPFHSELLRCLTGNRLQRVQEAPGSESSFEIAPDSRDVCGAFAGLSLSGVKSANDRVFGGGGGTRNLITVGGEPFFATIPVGNSTVFLLGSEDVADIDAEAEDDWLAALFSGFVPHAMALRAIFGEQSWRPARSYASVIVDDPLLRSRYGFLEFEELIQLMARHRFSTTLAFIPHNFRRSSPRVVRLFRNQSDRLSLCYHGNDHTDAEFAASDPAQLNTMIRSAEGRIAQHCATTGLRCDRIMIFPQGKFSTEAMAVLRSANFEAAVNTTPHPWRQQVRLTLRELAQPAVLRYAGFPLFLRTNSLRMQDPDIAVRLFFGIPIFIGEHHDIFEDPRCLLDAVNRINRAAPEIRWAGAGAAVRGSVLHRRDANGCLHVKAYAGTVRVEPPSDRREQIVIHWSDRGQNLGIADVWQNGEPCPSFESNGYETSVAAILEPSIAEEFSLRFRPTHRIYAAIGLRYSIRAFIRRRLSEIRDNYISRNPRLLQTARALQRCVPQFNPRLQR